jgi:hypothetical protein
MRKLVLALLLANLLYLAWNQWIRVPDSRPVMSQSRDVPTLHTPAERPPERRRPPPPEPSPPAPRPACYSLGPFPDPAAARVFADELAAADIDYRLQARETTVSGGWWVYLGPLDSRQAAQDLTVRLADAGITDFYIVPGGEFRNAISLGVFRESDRAQGQAARARNLGLTPVVRERQLTESAFWLDFEALELPGGLEDLAAGGSVGQVPGDEASADAGQPGLELRECPATDQNAGGGQSDAWFRSRF